MISKKPLKYYRLEKKIDQNGRVKTSAVYIGGDFTLTPTVSLSTKRLIICLCVLSWLVFLGALSFISRASQVSYVILPFGIASIPLFIMTTTAASLLIAKELLDRYKAETIAKRLPLSALFTAGLSGASFLGLIVFVIKTGNGFPLSDIVFGIISLIIAISSLMIYKKVARIKAVLVESSQDSD